MQLFRTFSEIPVGESLPLPGKKRVNLDDSNFDMENYSSLVDVKLLLKRILDGY